MPSPSHAATLRDLVVYVSHSFSPAYDSFTKDEFRLSIQAILDEAQKPLAEVGVTPFFTNEDYHTGLQEAIRRTLDASDYAIIDISDGSRSVMYECGYLAARGVDCLLIKSDASQSKLQFPERYADIGDRTVCFYSDLDDLHVKCQNAVTQKLSEKAATRRVKENWIHDVWFPAACGTIRVVCPQIADPGEYARRNSPDFTYLDNLGDTDTLLEAMVFLSRHYPRANIEKFSSRDLPGQLIEGNLVVIGGPGNDETFGNGVARIMMDELESRVSYNDDCESMCIQHGNDGATTYEPTLCEGKGNITGDVSIRGRDYGYFAAARNPMNSDTRVVLINGVHTAGVLGAFRALSDHSDSFANYVALFERVLHRSNEIAAPPAIASFEMTLDVSIVGGYVKVPRIDTANVWPLT